MDASRICQESGGQLWSINSHEEWLHIYNSLGIVNKNGEYIGNCIFKSTIVYIGLIKNKVNIFPSELILNKAETPLRFRFVIWNEFQYTVIVKIIKCLALLLAINVYYL